MEANTLRPGVKRGANKEGGGGVGQTKNVFARETDSFCCVLLHAFLHRFVVGTQEKLGKCKRKYIEILTKITKREWRIPKKGRTCKKGSPLFYTGLTVLFCDIQKKKRMS